MTSPEWTIDILRSWSEAAPLRQEWRQLQARADTPSPFASFAWLESWYRAYCAPEQARIVVVRKDGRLRALLPARREERRLGGLRLACLSYAGTCYTPRCGVIAAAGDLEAARQAMQAITAGEESIHLGVLADVEVGSLTWKALAGPPLVDLHRHTENRYQAPGYAVEGGWPAYLEARSKPFRKRLRQSVKACAARGPVSTRVYAAGADLAAGLDRVRELEGLTWQGQTGWGLFRNDQDDAFYRHLGNVGGEDLELEIEVLEVGGRPVAFLLLGKCGRTAFQYRTGYDREFEDCRPGVVLRGLASERLAAAGIAYFDLGAGVYEEKRRWETARRGYESYWLVNRRTVKGRLLQAELALHGRLKNLLARQRPAIPEVGGTCDEGGAWA